MRRAPLPPPFAVRVDQFEWKGELLGVGNFARIDPDATAIFMCRFQLGDRRTTTWAEKIVLAVAPQRLSAFHTNTMCRVRHCSVLLTVEVSRVFCPSSMCAIVARACLRGLATSPTSVFGCGFPVPIHSRPKVWQFKNGLRAAGRWLPLVPARVIEPPLPPPPLALHPGNRYVRPSCPRSDRPATHRS